jgi:ABC-type transport system involved in multi-copper enzyme maturation permease subunit
LIGLLLSRELTITLRRSGFHLLVTVQAILALLLVFSAERLVRQLTPTAPPSLGATTQAIALTGLPLVFSSSVDTVLLLVWSAWLVLSCAFAVPALAGGIIARDRERGTLAVILGTGARPETFVAAKLSAAVLLIAILLASGLPALGIALVFGTPSLASVAAAATIVLAWGVLVAGVALACSALARNAPAGIAASLVATGLLFFVTFVVPVLAPSFGVTVPPLIYRMNPVSAVLLTEPEVGRRLIEQLAGGPWLASFGSEADLLGPGRLPFVAIALGLTLVLTVIASALVARWPSDD